MILLFRLIGQQIPPSQLIYFSDEIDFLLEGDVSRKLIATVSNVVHPFRLAFLPQGVDQDNPELVGWKSTFTLTFAAGGVWKVPNGRILRKQSIPIHVFAQMNGSKECRHRRRSQDHIAGDLIRGLPIDRVASEDSKLIGALPRGGARPLSATPSLPVELERRKCSPSCRCPTAAGNAGVEPDRRTQPVR